MYYIDLVLKLIECVYYYVDWYNYFEFLIGFE